MISRILLRGFHTINHPGLLSLPPLYRVPNLGSAVPQISASPIASLAKCWASMTMDDYREYPKVNSSVKTACGRIGGRRLCCPDTAVIVAVEGPVSASPLPVTQCVRLMCLFGWLGKARALLGLPLPSVPADLVISFNHRAAASRSVCRGQSARPQLTLQTSHEIRARPISKHHSHSTQALQGITEKRRSTTCLPHLPRHSRLPCTFISLPAVFAACGIRNG